MNSQDQQKHRAAAAALEAILAASSGSAASSVLGVGTGSTVNFFIGLLGQLPARQRPFGAAVASSDASEKKLREQGIPLMSLNEALERGLVLHFYVDGADEINARLEMIKGGGAALTREKIVAAAARQFICIADQGKLVSTLGRFPLPLEVIQMASGLVAQALQALGGQPKLRAGVVTDNGQAILDVAGLVIDDAPALETQLNQLAGVVTNGLFALRPADWLFLATPDGVKTLTRHDAATAAPTPGPRPTS